MSKNLCLAAALLCACTFGSAAQDVELCVDSLLQRVAVHNADVKAARSRLDADREGIAVAKNARLPEISASLTLDYLGDGTILDRDFSNAMRDKLPHFGNTLNVTLYQPVYQGGAITAGIEMARWQTAISEIAVEQQLDASSIEALQRYFSLMQMSNLRRVYAENIALTEKLIDNIRQRHLQGVALKNDITRYELRLSSLRYDLQTVENRISVLSNDLCSLLGLEPGAAIRPTETVSLPEDAVASEAYWQQLTMTESNDLKAVDISHSMAETALKLEKARKLPSIGLIAGDNLSGPVTFEIPAIDKNYNAWFVGVNIKYNFSSLYTNRNRETQKKLEIAHIADSRFALEEGLQRRVHQCYIAMQQAREMLETEKVNVRLANENYDIVETRFTNDMALLTDMLDASTAKLDSEVRLVNANIDLILAYYQLKFISGTL